MLIVVGEAAALSELKESLDFVRTNDDLTFLQEVEPEYLSLKNGLTEAQVLEMAAIPVYYEGLASSVPGG